ncbi:PREDICTED: receptor-type tyrosine-protein phosphatase N2-like isoform X3 [Papilio xuthus]|uniref:Receptor-type tyrosine-protein phosphatase N2-like isoform X3 n=1 Tax=Papilio xuthus TaxID=66420 RepID=A0AAJ7EKA8_PAPXU|nr:PREDICTED: receptor-type tyrosine-protein phosphatase N2-like isoform X3 [Papilio xuthus]
MSQSWRRQALWALVVLSTLAPPTRADGNIGCLFSASLCIDGVEWCYDDFAFGKCMSIYESEPEDGSLYKYDMSSQQLQWFEGELQRLAMRGYRWEHAYTQCVLQAMLYALRHKVEPTDVNSKLCEHFADPKLSTTTTETEDEDTDMEPDETAFVRFMPNSALSDSDYANEVYNPPLPDDDPSPYIIPKVQSEMEGETPSDKIRNLMLVSGLEESPVIVPFEGFRERLQAEKDVKEQNGKYFNALDKEKKSLAVANRESNSEKFPDEERLGAHFRKMKVKPYPYTAEYLTSNYSPLDAEVHSNALEKYKQSFAEKNFPFEYENPGDIQESRIYIDNDDLDEAAMDAGSGKYDPYNLKAKGVPDQVLSQALHDHNDYDYDPSYTYVLFKNRFLTDWEKGLAFISKLEELLGLEKDTFTNPRVDPSEVTFKVEKNSKGYDAEEVAKRVVDIKDVLRRETGALVLSTGVGDRSKRPVISQIDEVGSQYFDYGLPILLTLIGSCTVVVVGAVIFAVMLKRDIDAKKKMVGLASAADIDAEATRDYQELCRARMSGKWSGQQPAAPPHADAPQRITSLSKEPEGNSPSTRSSTSSWSEEPALTNMDISTGHMVLAYMEDHLRNKDRLEQEWRALCAYEAEPSATAAALRPDNTGKNRYPDVLPYDHSRVTLNTLTNHLGSDYINASTITDHDPRNPAYIAAAGPLAHTAPDFWQLVWEQGSVVMVMLTRLTENGQQLCHRYWPEEGSELYHIYEVHLVSEHIWCDDYLVRSFYLKNQRTGETRTVTQFHFLSWPENGVPASTKALLEFRRKVNKSYRGRSCPIVVHCSDGAGRTGTYCLIDMVLNRMAKGAKEIDIAATLEHIRDQRPRTVATKQQFEFVLMAVAEEVHAILKALPAHLQQLQEKKDKEKEKEKEKDKDGTEKPN